MKPITPTTKVFEVVEKRPETVDVFLSHGCPDMRRGIFRMMSRIMTVRRAAFIHRIPLETLLQDLNAAETRAPETAAPQEAAGEAAAPEAGPRASETAT